MNSTPETPHSNPAEMAKIGIEAIRRNKLAFGAGAAVAAALVMGLTLAAVGWMETRIQRDRALEAKQHAEKARRSEMQQRQTHLDLKTLRARAEDVVSMPISPDGQRIVTGS